ncbi:hypothetical protein PHMEG_0005283 [Phytophthora megakarya]|uniref:Uncharacterized protein n=1 Tax=Phytophthora megakarya TaxID=4795 RepID=A0A225WRN1_9STRA|nr:hypothetical protein PHMEG_0005283 [Phytophthora megakarya]
MATGGVASAFRNIPLAAEVAGRFTGAFLELGILVVDLSCTFGWSDSPRHYFSACEAIIHLHVCASPQWPEQSALANGNFDGKAWWDDYICIGLDVGSRLGKASISLRTAMTTILGPHACIEEKVTTLVRQRSTLESYKIASIQVEKIMQAIGQIQVINKAIKQLSNLLGSLHHVTTCIRAAAHFSNESPLEPERLTLRDFGRDLRWFAAIIQLERLNPIPLSCFSSTSAPDHLIFMDASDRGLGALWPGRKIYLHVEFDEEGL